MKKQSFFTGILQRDVSTRASLLAIFLLLIPVSIWSQNQKIIVDHSCTHITQIPETAILAAKQNLHIAYGHTSHGSQLITGMNGLVAFMNGKGYPNNLYAWNEGGTGGALDIRDGAMGGDVGYYPDWVDNTHDYLGAANAAGRGSSNPDINVIIWSWCGQAAGLTAQQMISNYLTPMTNLENEYFGVKFVYMTGHLDGSGSAGNLNVRNNQIRNYCNMNNKILYDFADIESYDPDGLTHYMPLLCNDNCDYVLNGNSHNWALEWQSNHTINVDWYNCSPAHTQALNGNLKAYAAWRLWARLGGWSGGGGAQYTISGQVTAGSSGLPGVRINGLSGNPNTNSDGYYSTTVDAGWSGSATPTLAGYTFSPANRTYTNINSNQTGQNYTATVIPSIKVNSPNGGESWPLGSSQVITWDYKGLTGNVRLFLVKDNIKLGVIATVPAAQKVYQWVAGRYSSGSAIAGIDYKIKVVTTDNVYSDFSDNPFAITAAGGGLLAHYPLDGDGKDASGNGLDAMLQGTAPEATDRFGYVDGSLAFDGFENHAEVRLRENEPLIGEEGFAVCGWVKIGATEKARGIWSVMDGSEWLALELRADRCLVLRMSASNSELLAAETLAIGRWVFILVQFDSRTNRCRLYVDGALAAETVHMPVLPGRGRHIWLARSPAAGYLDGALDDFRFYRRPLADAEIRQLLNEKRRGSDLLAYYALDGDARDISGNGRHGDSGGAPGTADRRGRAGAALRSEGLRLPAVEAAEMAGGFTLNVWLQPDGAGRWQTLFGEADGELVLRLTPENRLELELAGERREYEPLAAKRWVMVTLVSRVEKRIMEIYQNGRLSGRCARPAAGMFSGPWLAKFAGAVDDARFYRRALTVEEIGKHFIERN